MNVPQKYHICSYGGSGSTALYHWLRRLRHTDHIHCRSPPARLTHTGMLRIKSCHDFSDRPVSKDDLAKHSVLFIYRRPSEACLSLLSRFPFCNVARNLDVGPGDPTQSSINSTPTSLYGRQRGPGLVVQYAAAGKDALGLAEFLSNWIETPAEPRNYEIVLINYHKIWDDPQALQDVLHLSDLEMSTFPKKQKSNRLPRAKCVLKQLGAIYDRVDRQVDAMPIVSVMRCHSCETEIK